MEFISKINQFLACPTPSQWVEKALVSQAVLLIDHAHCEKKAASTALNLMFRYVDRPKLIYQMSRLAREELRHFEKVIAIMQARNIVYDHLTPARYAQELRKHIRTYEPQKLIDHLIIGAIVEARSCERFAMLVPHLDNELATFYHSLLTSEARHYEGYIELAKLYSPDPLDERIAQLIAIEADLIMTPDTEFRFHSGLPA